MAQDVCGEVSAAHLMAHMTRLAQRTKLSGTADELDSLREIQASLDAYGYVTQLLHHDAYISLPGRARVTVSGQELACITHSFSQASRGITAPLVDVGAGDAAGFAGRPVAGCIAFVRGMARPDVSRRASEAGCAGQLHASPNDIPHEMCISPVWGSPTHETVGQLPRTVVCSISREAGADLRQRLAAGEAIEATLEAEVDTGWRKTPILVADLGPEDAAANAPFVLLSGHHDTWYRGVMDNGGANATMLEVARLAAAQRATWRRGLRVAFWSGHSHGRYSGSAWYADQYWDELNQRCVAHVNVDSTGARGNLSLRHAIAASELRALAADAVLRHGGQHLEGERMSRAGDQSFWGVGVPSIFMSLGQQEDGGLGWWWHTPEDTLDKIEPDILVRDTRIYEHVVLRLLSEAVLPLDYGTHTRELLGTLRDLQAVAGGRFDLQPAIDRAERLAQACERLAACAPGDAAEAGRLNGMLMRLSRALVPIDYTAGDRCEPDPALPLPVCPALAPVRELAASPPGSDGERFLAVALMRGRNRVCAALDAALDATRGVVQS